jgi:hypothetical protein
MVELSFQSMHSGCPESSQRRNQHPSFAAARLLGTIVQ